MVIFHSYVKLPEGKVHKVSWHRSRAAGKTPVAYRGLSFKKKNPKHSDVLVARDWCGLVVAFLKLLPSLPLLKQVKLSEMHWQSMDGTFPIFIFWVWAKEYAVMEQKTRRPIVAFVFQFRSYWLRSRCGLRGKQPFFYDRKLLTSIDTSFWDG